MASSVPRSLLPGKTSRSPPPVIAADVTPTMLAMPTKQTSLVSPTEQGWKITITNVDGTSNEVTIEPKPEEDDEDEEDPNNLPPPPSTRLRIYLVVQYILNLTLALTILVIMILTLIKYNRTSSIPGAWPPTAILSPTILMLGVSALNIIIDVANLLVQCCGARAVAKMADITTRIRNFMGILTALAPGVAAGFSAFAKDTSGGKDIWGYSCSDAADRMQQVNSSSTICMTNGIAWDLQILQIVFQLLSVLVPLFAQMKPSDKPDGRKPAKARKGSAKEKAKVGDEEAIRLIGDNKAFESAFSTQFGGGSFFTITQLLLEKDPSSARKAGNLQQPIIDLETLSKTVGGGSLVCHPPPIPTPDEFELSDYNEVRRRQGLRAQVARAENVPGVHEADEMKFSHSIQFNAVPDWSSHYIAYSNLKKLIYQLEKNQNRPGPSGPDAESSPLIEQDVDPDRIFARALDQELEKISSFYQLKELEIYGEVTELLKDEEAFNNENRDGPDGAEAGRPSTGRPRQGSIIRGFLSHKQRQASTISQSEHGGVEDSDDDEDELSALHRPKSSKNRRKSAQYDLGSSVEDMRASTDMSRSLRRNSQVYDDFAEQAFSAMYSSGITLKKRAISLYVQLCELKSFVQLNKTGFSKVLKKYDKILDRNLKSTYMGNSVVPAYPFRSKILKHIDENITKMEIAYANIVTQGDVALAKKELRLHLREHVVWERNTVWREMIGIERKSQAANMGIRRTLLGIDTDPATARRQGDGDADETKELRTPIGRFTCPTWLFSSTMYTLIGIVAIFFILLWTPIMKKVEEQNCLAMVVFVSLLWATEVIPLFVTSLMIPFLSVVLRVVRDDEKPHSRLDAEMAAPYIFSAMWTPVIMLLLGGFAIAAALSKYDIAKRIATFVLSKAGTRPRTVLLTNMFVAAFASMWISNVAAPVLCFSIISPMLRNLPSNSEMSKALILGIALASNIGGMLSPIASPQNIIALSIMSPQPSWGVWFFIALPVGIISIFLIWLLLLITFKPGRGTTIVPIRPVRDRFSGVQWFISLVTLATIILWIFSHQLEDKFGDMGVIAIIPLVLFFGTGILTKEDFNNFLWTIIILAAGGLSLGKAVKSSGLLHSIAGAIAMKVEGLSVYGILVVFASLILVVATFISHTVAAVIILPLVSSVGSSMQDQHPNLLVMGSALMCSAAMGLPTSGFPNMTAIMMEDSQTGQRYLKVKHFISRGIPSSIITLIVVITLGYGSMLIVGM